MKDYVVDVKSLVRLIYSESRVFFKLRLLQSNAVEYPPISEKITKEQIVFRVDNIPNARVRLRRLRTPVKSYVV